MHKVSTYMDRPYVSLDLVVTSGGFDVREQYVVYDFNSFVADVGGFLGLLLGHSAFSLFKSVEKWFGRKVESSNEE